MSDERFARQYRFGPPSGFPLTSTCASIVHHLSGPSAIVLARHFTKDHARIALQLSLQESVTHRIDFSALGKFGQLLNSQSHWTPWPVFQDG